MNPHTRNPHKAPEPYRTAQSLQRWDERRIASAAPHDRLAHRAQVAATMGSDCLPVVWIYSSTWIDWCVSPGTAAAWHAGQVLASVMWRAAAKPGAMEDYEHADEGQCAAGQLELFA